MFVASVVIVQYFCAFVEFIVVKATVVIGQYFCVGLTFIVVTAGVIVVRSFYVFCGVNCGYRNSRYVTILLCCVWSVLWLQLH